MFILVACRCGRKLRADPKLAGRIVKCPQCGQPVQIPTGLAPPAPVEQMVVLEEETPEQPSPTAGSTQSPSSVSQTIATASPLNYPASFQAPNLAAHNRAKSMLAPPAANVASAERSWRGYIFWALLLAMIPLGIHTFSKHENGLERLKRTLENHPDVADKIDLSDRPTQADVRQLFALLPEHRLDGALVPRDSWIHWPIALAATGLFFAIVTFAIPGFPARPLHLLFAGIFTGTAGVLLLLAIQIFGIFCCIIGAAYLAALDPNAPFGASLIGFFFGVGFLEELIKSLPVLYLIYTYESVPWRTACLWGMASGAGFGISEGIHYAPMYNGIEPAGIYFVRFLSCVAFHTLLSGACAIFLQRKQNHLQEGTGFFDWLMTLMAIISLPILLHGLFDTLIKKEFHITALAVAILSFSGLAMMIKSSRRAEIAAVTVAKAKPKVVRTEGGTRYVG